MCCSQNHASAVASMGLGSMGEHESLSRVHVGHTKGVLMCHSAELAADTFERRSTISVLRQTIVRTYQSSMGRIGMTTIFLHLNGSLLSLFIIVCK